MPSYLLLYLSKKVSYLAHYAIIALKYRAEGFRACFAHHTAAKIDYSALCRINSKQFKQLTDLGLVRGVYFHGEVFALKEKKRGVVPENYQQAMYKCLCLWRLSENPRSRGHRKRSARQRRSAVRAENLIPAKMNVP